MTLDWNGFTPWSALAGGVLIGLATALYLPAAHAEQPEVPVARLLYMPATHAVHTKDVDAAATVPNDPAAHAEQVPPLAPLNPALH